MGDPPAIMVLAGPVPGASLRMVRSGEKVAEPRGRRRQAACTRTTHPTRTTAATRPAPEAGSGARPSRDQWSTAHTTAVASIAARSTGLMAAVSATGKANMARYIHMTQARATTPGTRQARHSAAVRVMPSIGVAPTASLDWEMERVGPCATNTPSRPSKNAEEDHVQVPNVRFGELVAVTQISKATPRRNSGCRAYRRASTPASVRSVMARPGAAARSAGAVMTPPPTQRRGRRAAAGRRPRGGLGQFGAGWCGVMPTLRCRPIPVRHEARAAGSGASASHTRPAAVATRSSTLPSNRTCP